VYKLMFCTFIAVSGQQIYKYISIMIAKFLFSFNSPGPSEGDVEKRWSSEF